MKTNKNVCRITDNIKRSNILILLFFIISYSSYAQSRPELPRAEVRVMPPDAAIIERYTMQPPNLSNGHVEQTINLFEINEKGVSFSLNLFYYYSGFRVRENATRVGLGWGLSEGIITRRIMHVDDNDLENRSIYKNYLHIGRDNYTMEEKIGGTGSASGCSETPTDAVLNYLGNYNYTANRAYYKLYDVQPDLYTFNFNGYTGKFVIVPDGSDRHKKAVMLEHNDLDFFMLDNGFGIIDPKGIEYEFNSGDFTCANRNISAPSGCGPSIPTYTDNGSSISYKLTRIYNPNTKGYINLAYDTYQDNTLKPLEEHQTITLVGVSQLYDSGGYHPELSFREYGIKKEETQYVTTNVLTTLKSIETESTYIDFIYIDDPEKILKEIKVFHKSDLNNPVKTILFMHDFFGNSVNRNTRWLKLKELKINGGNDTLTYKFDYVDENYTSDLLKKSSMSIDHWGYYNGVDNKSLFPEEIISLLDSRSLYQLTGRFKNYETWAKSRKPDFKYKKKFALQKITFPTGGYSQYDYENASFGIRVKQIKEYDGEEYNIRYYNYDSGYGVGAYYYPDEYKVLELNVSLQGYLATREKIVYASCFPVMSDLYEYRTHQIDCYSKVTELFGDSIGSAGKIEYEYNTTDYYFPFIKPILLSKSFYDSVNTIVRTEKYAYDSQRLGQIKYYSDPKLRSIGSASRDTHLLRSMPGDDGWFGYRLGYFEFRMKYLDYYWVKLKSQAITQDGVTTTTTFKYRSTDTEKKKPLDCNVIGIEMSNSNQKKVVSAYKYPRDYDLNDSFVEYMAIERNMVEIMMEQRDSVGTTETQLYKVSYISWGEHENPINLKSYKIIAPSLFTLTRKGETQNLQQVHIYDIHGNPVYITENNSDKTVYFWGYNHQYPIIEVKNKAYDEIKSSLSSPSQGFYDGFMSQANPPDGMIQSFGDMLRRELTDALVTTYTYKPLVGMTSMTDPRGVTTYYDYDDFGRLKETYRMENGVKKIVQVHDYHYSLP